MCDKNELSNHWIEKQFKISDVLTKKGAPYQALVEAL